MCRLAQILSFACVVTSLGQSDSDYEKLKFNAVMLKFYSDSCASFGYGHTKYTCLQDAMLKMAGLPATSRNRMFVRIGEHKCATSKIVIKTTTTLVTTKYTGATATTTTATTVTRTTVTLTSTTRTYTTSKGQATFTTVTQTATTVTTTMPGSAELTTIGVQIYYYKGLQKSLAEMKTRMSKIFAEKDGNKYVLRWIRNQCNVFVGGDPAKISIGFAKEQAAGANGGRVGILAGLVTLAAVLMATA